ncbi:MAG: glyoxylase-like metal-dependent hydrolase (beta-lactamase superfamily II) [Candidatus Aldehydirespiratoraceae bacterium]|jgi:glyoxylase-like metal-dependent hydrolase (beta-lactamase superfamily II)
MLATKVSCGSTGSVVVVVGVVVVGVVVVGVRVVVVVDVVVDTDATSSVLSVPQADARSNTATSALVSRRNFGIAVTDIPHIVEIIGIFRHSVDTPPLPSIPVELTEIADGILVALRPSTGFGSPNMAAVIEDDGITVVDSGTVPRLGREFADALAPTGVPIRHLVYTSPHIDHVGGSTAFPLAAVYGTPETSALLDQPPNVEAYSHMAPELANDFLGLTTRPVTHTVREAAWISARVVIAPSHGQVAENLVVQIPDANVVLAGAMATFGVIPPAWGGNPSPWADQLDVILGWGTTIVPSHGPVGGENEVRELQQYLRSLLAPGEGPWDRWANQRFHVANIERAAMLAAGDPAPPPSILALMGIS